MTLQKRERLNAGDRLVVSDDAVFRFGTDDDFELKYNDSNDEVVVEHLSSGDQFLIGGVYFNLTPQDSAPSSPDTGDVAMQDGSNWDPASSGAQELVTYNGTSWVSA